MLLKQGSEAERSFVLGMAREAIEKGENLTLTAVTTGFEKKHHWSNRPSLFEAIKQLNEEGLIRLENHEDDVLVRLPEKFCSTA